MADHLWRRIGAVRLSIIVGATGVLAGFGIGRGAQPATVDVDPAGSAVAAAKKTKPTISGRNVIDGSLLLADFKKGALEKRFYTKEAANAQFITYVPSLSTANQLSKVLVRAWDPVKKKEVVGGVSPSGLLGDYAKTGDTAVDSARLGGQPAGAFVAGSGSVLTASRIVGAASASLFAIPGTLGVDVAVDQKSGGAAITLTNLGATDLSLAATNTVPTTGTIAPGGSLGVVLAPGSPGTLQFVGCPTCIHTLNLSAFGRPGGQVEVVAQGLSSARAPAP
jgi:hypothetical protein